MYQNYISSFCFISFYKWANLEYCTMNLCHQNQNLLKKDVPCPTPVYETKPLFLDMAINISIAIFERHGFTASSICKQMSQRHQQPESPDPFRWTNLIPIKRQFAIGLAEKYLHRSYVDILEMPILGSSKYWLYNTLYIYRHFLLWRCNQHHFRKETEYDRFMSVIILASEKICQP